MSAQLTFETHKKYELAELLAKPDAPYYLVVNEEDRGEFSNYVTFFDTFEELSNEFSNYLEYTLRSMPDEDGPDLANEHGVVTFESDTETGHQHYHIHSSMLREEDAELLVTQIESFLMNEMPHLIDKYRLNDVSRHL